MTQVTQPTPGKNPPANTPTGITPSVALNQRALLCGLKIGQWSPNKKDKEVGREVASQKGVHGITADKAGKYVTRLIPDSDKLTRVSEIARAAREAYYQKSLPWSQEGQRIVSAELWLNLNIELLKLKGDFEKAVQEFINEFPTLQAQAQQTLGQLYRVEHYPSQTELLEKFTWEVSVLPVPVGGDFRVDLGETTTELYKARIQAETEQAVKKAMQDAWKRLREPVQAMAERLGQPDAVFKNTLTLNVEEAVNNLAALNLTDDPAFSGIITEVKDKLTGFTPDQLRTDKATRAEVAKDAKSLLDAMSAYFGTPIN
jgi:hypothetical protein